MVWGSEDLKSVGAPLPLEQKHTFWIRTGNLSLTKRNALTTEPRMQIWHVKNVNHCDYKVLLQKRIHNQKNMNHSLVARQLWCWVPQWRYDLGTLMKCVCKVIIYHRPETQHFIMVWRCCSRSWMLRGSAPHKSENMNTQEWLILPPFVVGGLVIIHSIDANSRIRVIASFQCLYRSKFFLP